MPKFLVKEILFPKTSYFGDSQLLRTRQFLIQLYFRFFDFRMEEKAIIVTNVWSFRDFDRFIEWSIELGFHVADEFHEQRAVLFFLLLLELGKYIIVVPLDKLPLEDLEGLDEWLIILTDASYFLFKILNFLQSFLIHSGVLISLFLGNQNLLLQTYNFLFEDRDHHLLLAGHLLMINWVIRY